MTKNDYELLILASADESGKLEPPQLDDYWAQSSILLFMWFRSEIERRGPECRPEDRSGPYYITQVGRERLAQDGIALSRTAEN